jgi:hypothetical protein
MPKLRTSQTKCLASFPIGLGAKRLHPLLSLPFLIGTLQNFQHVIHAITESSVEQYEIPPVAFQVTIG